MFVSLERKLELASLVFCSVQHRQHCPPVALSLFTLSEQCSQSLPLL